MPEAQTKPVEREAKVDRLTVEQMRAILAKGQVVIMNGIAITNAADLPTKADLALGDEAAENAALEDLDSKMEALQAERDKVAEARKARETLNAAPPAPVEDEKPEPKKDEKAKP